MLGTDNIHISHTLHKFILTKIYRKYNCNIVDRTLFFLTIFGTCRFWSLSFFFCEHKIKVIISCRNDTDRILGRKPFHICLGSQQNKWVKPVSFFLFKNNYQILPRGIFWLRRAFFNWIRLKPCVNHLHGNAPKTTENARTNQKLVFWIFAPVILSVPCMFC